MNINTDGKQMDKVMTLPPEDCSLGYTPTAPE